MGILIRNNIVNQKGNPAWYEDTLAARPIANLQGRMFVDTDNPSTGIYRDTGSSWIQVADPGAGTTGTLQQVTTNGKSTNVGISVTANGIGIGTTTPNTNRLDIHAASGIQATFNGTGTANSSLQLQLAGVGKWNVSNKYNSAANDFAITDVLNNLDRLTITNAGIGTFTGLLNISSRLNVNGATDNSSYALNVANSSALINNLTIGKGLGNLSTNMAIGYLPLITNTTGSNNSAIGYGALYYNTTGSNNTALGFSALLINSIGSYNTAIGMYSGYYNSTGSYNTGIGHGSNYNINTGSNNTGIGFSALTDLQSGSNNTVLGYNSGIGLTTGSNNTIIGANVTISLSTTLNNIILADGSGLIRLQFTDTGVLNLTGPATSAAIAAPSTHKIAIKIGGVQYYLLASNV